AASESETMDNGNSNANNTSSSSGGAAAEPTRWSAMEREQYRAAFVKHGKEFKLIAEAIKTKNLAQVKNYYHNNKKKLIAAAAAALVASSTTPPLTATPPTSLMVPRASASPIPSPNAGSGTERDSDALTFPSSDLSKNLDSSSMSSQELD